MSEPTESGLPSLLLAAGGVLLTLFLIAPANAPRLKALCENRPARDDGALISRLARDGAPDEPETDEPETDAPETAETQAPSAPAPETTEAPDDARDLAALRAAYLEAHEGSPGDGVVTETFFTDQAATDRVGNVFIRNCTASKRPDFAALLAQGPSGLPDPAEGPTVLIFHTHTSESYLPADNGVFYKDYPTRSKDPAQNVVRVGEAVRAALESRGIGAIHDTAIYDDAYEGAYARSREGVKKLLAENPTVKIVLDVHRDAIYPTGTSAIKPTAVIGGEKTAQIMIITGAEEGLVTDFPGWEENLRFALALQNAAQTAYEGLMKPIYFCQRKYNMDLTPCSLLLEFGSDTNTLEEALRAGRLLGDALADLIIQNEKT